MSGAVKRIVLPLLALVFSAASIPVVGQTSPTQNVNIQSKKNPHRAKTTAAHDREHAKIRAPVRQYGTTPQTEHNPYTCMDPPLPPECD